MRALRRFLRRLTASVLGRSDEDRLREELAEHVTLLSEEFVRAGLPLHEAGRRARLKLGAHDATTEAYRDEQRLRGLEDLGKDLRYAIRMTARHPGFSAVVIATLAFGIGANTAIFSVVNAALVRPLPFAEPGRLMMISGRNEQKGLRRAEITPADWLDFRVRTRAFQGVAAFRTRRFTIGAGQGEPELVEGALVSSDFFTLLGLSPVQGRTFLLQEGQPGRDRVAIVSHALWQRRFGSDAALAGQSLTINGESHTVVGILPPGLNVPATHELSSALQLSVPLALDAEEQGNRSNHVLLGVARLAPAANEEQGQSELTGIARQLEAQHPDTNTGWTVNVRPLHEEAVADIRLALLALMAAVGFVLLIACTNIAGLLLARGTARAPEIAVRMALGATRLRIVRQLLVECLLLCALGAAAGVWLAAYGLRLFLMLSPAGLRPSGRIEIDATTLSFALTVSLATWLFFGLAPALRAAKPDLHSTLQEGGRSAVLGFRRRTQRLLVGSQVALSMVLLAGAALMIRSFVRVLDVNPGFNPDHLLTASLQLPTSKYRDARQQAAFYEHLVGGVGSLPGVVAAGAINHLPLDGSNSSMSFHIEGRPLPPPGEVLPSTNWRAITPGYFRAMGIALLRGRAFDEHDTAQAPAVVVINETMALRFWPGENPLGRRIRPAGQADAPWAEIVGITGDVKHWGVDRDNQPEAYYPHAQQTVPRMTLVVRSVSEPESAVAAIRQQVSTLDRDLPVSQVQTMERLFAESVSGRRFNMLLISVFAGAALLLAAIGLYGLMAYSVERRTREIGVRMAMGARRLDVLRLVIGQGMTPAFGGIAIGLMGALVLGRLLEGLLFGVSATDAIAFGGAAILLAGAALAACYLPARRAAFLDPVVALRRD